MSGRYSDPSVSYASLAKLARCSYQASEAYQVVLSALGDTFTGDADLCDADGVPTAADTDLVALRDELVEYVKTTMGRYEVAGAELEEILRAYDDADSDAAHDIEVAFADMETYGIGESDHSWDAAEEAEATDRPDDAPANGGKDDFAYESELSGEG